ncbi:DoxX family protein [Geodermatophilus chilensis]|uniref:DoxX family protein n=1 Tax=Geodermatophilus chilensis TaxID=2035835 RepID=UPI000C267014|nr:DoxX family protein [Geodermatophilus chilensis]
MTSLNKALDHVQPYALGLFRAVIGLLFASHGAASLFGIFGGAFGTNGGTVPAGVWPYWYAAVIQLACGLLVAAGLFTRVVALIASGSMAYAYFVVHQPVAMLPLQNDGEPAALFSWAFLLLVFTGSGALALDQVIGNRRSSGQPAVEVATAA